MVQKMSPDEDNQHPLNPLDDANLFKGFEGIPPILSPTQLADVLHVSTRTLERWRVAGEGPKYQHPKGTRIYRYYLRDILAWLEGTDK